VRVGILSDTHDDIGAMAAGMTLLKAAGAEFFVHCGDVGGEQILDLLAGMPCVFVWGNCDFDRAELARYAADIGVDCRGTFAELEFDGKKIAVTHGDEVRLMRLASGGVYHYVLTGHTHRIRDERTSDGVRIINPGALFLAARKTVAILDTKTDELKYLAVDI
jgi:hypothetical protein